MASTVWSGYLTLGLIPVRLVPGARSTRIPFHLLHRNDLTRVKQQLFCSAEERIIDRTEIVKGYEYRKGEYVVIEPEEICKIEPKTAKAMEIQEFVKQQEEIDPIYFESSYYLAPEEGGKKPYALLVRALEDTAFDAVAKVAMHNREYTAVLRAYKRGLVLHTLHYQDEIRTMPDFGTDHANLREAEIKVAHQLINALASKWDPGKYYDSFEGNVKKLIKARLEGKEITPVEKPQKIAPDHRFNGGIEREPDPDGRQKEGPATRRPGRLREKEADKESGVVRNTQAVSLRQQAFS